MVPGKPGDCHARLRQKNRGSVGTRVVLRRLQAADAFRRCDHNDAKAEIDHQPAGTEGLAPRAKVWCRSRSTSIAARSVRRDGGEGQRSQIGLAKPAIELKSPGVWEFIGDFWWHGRRMGPKTPRRIVRVREALFFGPGRSNPGSTILYTSGSTGKPRGVCTLGRLPGWGVPATYHANNGVAFRF